MDNRCRKLAEAFVPRAVIRGCEDGEPKETHFSPNGTTCCSHRREPVDALFRIFLVLKGRYVPVLVFHIVPTGLYYLNPAVLGLTPEATTYRHFVAEKI